MGTISAEDRAVIKQLRYLKPVAVLQSLKGHLLDQRKGIILVACSDGRQEKDKTQHLEMMQAEYRKETMIHKILDLGVAIRIAHNSRANKSGSTFAQDKLESISDSLAIMGVDTVCLFAHVPCAKATGCGLRVLDQLDLLIRGKERVREFCGSAVRTVACFLHVDYQTDKGKKTYFVCRNELKRFKSNQPQRELIHA